MSKRLKAAYLLAGKLGPAAKNCVYSDFLLSLDLNEYFDESYDQDSKVDMDTDSIAVDSQVMEPAAGSAEQFSVTTASDDVVIEDAVFVEPKGQGHLLRSFVCRVWF